MKQFIFSFLMLLCAVFSYGQSGTLHLPNIIESKPVTTLLYTGDVVGSISYDQTCEIKPISTLLWSGDPVPTTLLYTGDPMPQPAYDMGTMRLRLESPKPVLIESKCKPIDEAGNGRYRCLIGDGYIAEFSGKAITNRPYDSVTESEDCNNLVYFWNGHMVAMTDSISGQISVFDSRYPEGYVIYSDWFTGAKTDGE